MRRTVIFDLDGTLVDSAPDITAALNRMLGSRGLPTISDERAREFIGDGTRTLVARALVAAGAENPTAIIEDAFREYGARYSERLVDRTQLYPGVLSLLSACAKQNISCCLCTNKDETHARQILEHFEMARFFERVIGGNSTRFHKPDRELVSMCLTENRPVTVFGDGAADFGLAKNADCDFVLARYGYVNFDYAEAGVQKIADRPMALLSYLE